MKNKNVDHFPWFSQAELIFPPHCDQKHIVNTPIIAVTYVTLCNLYTLTSIL